MLGGILLSSNTELSWTYIDIKHHNNKHHRYVCRARPLFVCMQVYRDTGRGVFVGWHKLLEIVPKMMCSLLRKNGYLSGQVQCFCRSQKPVSISLSMHVFSRTKLLPLNNGRTVFALEWVPNGRLFAVGGCYNTQSLLGSVDMLQCPWDTKGTVNSELHYVASMHHARWAHAVAYFEGKLIASGGYDQKSVACFTRRTDGFQMVSG